MSVCSSDARRAPLHPAPGACRPARTHVFLLQVEDVVDGLLHVLWEPCHSHAVGVWGPTLWEANVHLEGAHTAAKTALRAPSCAAGNGLFLVKIPPREDRGPAGHLVFRAACALADAEPSATTGLPPSAGHAGCRRQGQLHTAVTPRDLYLRDRDLSLGSLPIRFPSVVSDPGRKR